MIKRIGAILIIVNLLPLLISSGATSWGNPGEDSPFGVVASPAKNRSFGRSPEKTIQWLKALGVKWVRVHWSWRENEPGKGNISKSDVTRYDDIVDLLRKEGFSTVLLLGGIPAWSDTRPKTEKGRKGKGHVPSGDNLSHVVEFLVGHYRGKVRHYQILNETTLPTHWIEPEEFARLMRIAYQRAKSQDPACKVIMGGFGTRSRIPKVEYLERFIRAGGADFVDIFDFHMYNYISRIYKDLPQLRAVLNKYTVAKPIWILETGDPSNFTDKAALQEIARGDSYREEGPWDWPTFDEEEQARRLVKRMVLALSQGVEKVFWYSFQDRIPREKVKPTYKRSGHKNTKGLMYTDFTPKQSFFAYKFLISQLNGAHFMKALDLGDRNHMGFLFRNHKGPIAVVWCWEGSAQIRLGLDAKKVQIHDKLGKALGIVEVTEGNTVPITITPDPRYVVTLNR
jgi:hypothetical protein